jgi:signal transduction histidine kinase
MDVLKVVKPGRFVFPLACLAAVAMVFISEASYWQSVQTLDRLGSITAARTNLLNWQRGIINAETGQRGYLLTGRKEYLQPYDMALQEVEQSFKSLDRYYRAEPHAQEVLGKLQAVTDSKLSEIELTIRLIEEGKFKASMEIILTDIGREKMDAIRALSSELLALEARKVESGRTDIYRTLMLSRIGMAALSAIGLLALFMYLRQTFALKRQQQELQRIVQVERDRLEIEVAQRTAQLTELTHHLQTAIEDERSRLARNLHDDLGALLTSAKLDAARIKSRLGGTAPDALELLVHLVETLNSGIALGRRIIEDLRPSALSNLGLVATLEILVREFSEHSGVEVHCSLEPVELHASAELTVYRLVQEAITNITKYAKAKNVWVTLSAQSGRVDVSVRDDGVGFDSTVPPNSAYGLLGMRFRVEAEGGTLTLLSSPSQGTLIRASLAPSKTETA